MAKPANHLLTQGYCRKLVGPPPTRSAGMFVFSLCFCDCFYGLAQLRALGVPFLMLLLGASQEVTKKSDFGKPKSQVCLFAVANIARGAGANIARQDVPSWISLSVPRYKEKDEIDILLACAVLQDSHHARQIWGAKCVAFLVGEGLAPPV